MAENTVRSTPPVVLTIAGYDPSSGAGVTADIKTISAHKCYGVSCVTALTVQSTRGVVRVEPLEGRIISETLEELNSDLEIAAIKIGMLGSGEAARSVSAFLKRYQPRRVVLDPVLKSSSGADLISGNALEILKQRLLPASLVITPNAEEAGILTGMRVNTQKEMEAAALQLRRQGVHNVIITGGHLDPPRDVVSLDSANGPVTLTGARVSTRSTHGTGCAFSTALACRIASGKNLLQAAKLAKSYVESALKLAPALGRGTGPVV